MYAEAVPPARHATGRALHIPERIGAAGRDDILDARLSPDRFTSVRGLDLGKGADGWHSCASGFSFGT